MSYSEFCLQMPKNWIEVSQYYQKASYRECTRAIFSAHSRQNSDLEPSTGERQRDQLIGCMQKEPTKWYINWA